MSNTTNYGWNTPNSTDLISDWVANFLTTFNAVDTAMINKAAPARAFVSGNYVGANAFTTGAAVNCQLNQNELSALPLYFDRDVTITALAIRVTVAAANTTYRLGIFQEANSLTTPHNWQPGNRIVDAGTVDGSTTGIRTITGLTTTLTGGRVYWLAVARQGSSTGTTQRIAGIPSTTSVPTAISYTGSVTITPTTPPGLTAFDAPDYQPYQRAPFATGISGALPTSFGTPASWSATNLPLVLTRIQ